MIQSSNKWISVVINLDEGLKYPFLLTPQLASTNAVSKACGLGFQNLRILNKAYIAKLAWKLEANPEKLWVIVMRAKYHHEVKSIHNIELSCNCSKM